MNLLHLSRKNLGRRKARTLFTFLSITIAFLLFGLLMALQSAFTAGVDLAGADRLITIHRVTFTQLLPISYVNRAKTVDGVNEVAHFTWFGGYYQEPRNQVPGFPTEPDQLFTLYPEYTLSANAMAAWETDRQGMIVGRGLAERYGWEVGDRIPLSSSIWPQNDGSLAWEFNLRGIFDGAPAAKGADEFQWFFHYDYFNETRQFARDQTGWLILQIDDPQAADRVAQDIDALFANSPAETKTTTEKGFTQGFVNQFGNITAMVSAVLAAVFFTMLLVTGNTMAQAVRERTRDLAVMKTLGFSNGKVLYTVIAESLLLAVCGGLLGLALAWLFAQGLSSSGNEFIPTLPIKAHIWVYGIGLILAFGLIAAALPGWRAINLNTVAALGRR